MIKLAHKTIDNKDLNVLIKFLKDKRYLNQSKITKKFEDKFSKKIKTKNSLFVNSGLDIYPSISLNQGYLVVFEQ